MPVYNLATELHAGRYHEVMTLPYGALAVIVCISSVALFKKSFDWAPWATWLIGIFVVTVLGVGAKIGVSTFNSDQRSLYVTGAYVAAHSTLMDIWMAQVLYQSDHQAYTIDRAALEAEVGYQGHFRGTIQLHATPAHFHASVSVPVPHNADQTLECERDDGPNLSVCTILWTSGRRMKVVAE